MNPELETSKIAPNDVAGQAPGLTTRDDTALPLVSIVSVYYNRAAYAEGSIRSVLEQTYDNVEVIVMDDGSTDDTLAVISGIEHPRLKVLSQANTGFTPALNKAIRASSGKYVAIHGSGDVSFPERIAKQVAIMEADAGIGVVGCLFENNESHNSAFASQIELSRDFRQQMLKYDPFTHGAVMFRRELFDRVGGYREEFRYAQDRDFWLRLSEICGYSIVEEVLYERRQPPNAVTRDGRKVLLQEYFADFAVQCALNKPPGGRDWIDLFGADAFFLRAPSSRVGRRLASAGLRARVMHEDATGRLFLAAARREKLSLRDRVLVSLSTVRSEAAWRVIKPILASLLTFIARSRKNALATGPGIRWLSEP